MKLLKKRFRVGKAVSLENYSGKGVLNTLKFICDIKRCTKENRIGVVKTGADERMSYKGGSVIVKTVPDVSEGIHVIVARLRDIVVLLMEGKRLV